MSEEMKKTDPADEEESKPQKEAAQSALPGGQPAENPDPPVGKGNPKKKKRRAILFLGVLFGLLALLIILNTLDFGAIAEKLKGDADGLPEQTAVTYPVEWFELPDYEEDVTADADYMQLDRTLSYKYGNEGFGVTDNPEAHGPLCVFWYNYRNALVAGDAGALNALYTDDYIEKYGRQGRFTPQKVFEFAVNLRDMQDLQDTGDANGNYKGYIVYYFEVSYHIKDNNGTFRRDFYDDKETVPLLFEVLERGNEIQINNYSRMRTISIPKEEKGVNFMMYIWIALILMSIIAELTTTALVAVWFIPAGVVSLILSIVMPDQIVIQIVAYTAVSALLLLLTRPLVKQHLQKGNYQPTNADMVIGRTAVVTEIIDNVAQTGEVSVSGKRWSARSADGTVIEKDQLVSVLEIQGVKLICAKAPKDAKIEK